VSSANRQKRSLSRKWATACGELGEVAGGCLGQLGPIERRPERLRFGEHCPQDPQRLRWIGSLEVVKGYDTGDRRKAREVRVNLDPLEVGDHEERRVLERVSVPLQLEVRGLEVLALALVLPGEEALLPDVGEAITSVELLGALLEGVPGAGRVGIGRGGLAQHPAQVAEVGLGRRPFAGGNAAPLRGELEGGHASRESAVLTVRG
jgi:hypothetical protein